MGWGGINYILVKYDIILLGHLSYSGDLLLWVGVRRCVVSVVLLPFISSSQELLDQSLPNLVCSICRVRRQETVDFMTP